MGHVRTILVVEDDDALRRMLARSLGRLAEVIALSSASDALEHLRTQAAPAVVITDVMMPGITGLDLAKAIRKMPHLAQMPIVMLSAKTAPSDVVVGINAGARHYLTKPFRATDLESKIQKLLQFAPATPALRAPALAAPPEPGIVEAEMVELELDELELVED